MLPESLRPLAFRIPALLAGLLLLLAIASRGGPFAPDDQSASGRRSARATQRVASPAASGPLSMVALDSARAEYASARDHHSRIMFLVRNFKNAEAGAEVLAAAEHLERGLHGAGERPDSRVQAVLRDARSGAGQLIREAGPVPVSVGIAVEALGVEVDRALARLAVSRQVRPGRPMPPAVSA